MQLIVLRTATRLGADVSLFLWVHDVPFSLRFSCFSLSHFPLIFVPVLCRETVPYYSRTSVEAITSTSGARAHLRLKAFCVSAEEIFVK